MDTATNDAPQARWNRPIPAKDGTGRVHFLVVVDHPAGLVSIADGEMVRIMSLPDAALLYQQLRRTVDQVIDVGVGPLSSVLVQRPERLISPRAGATMGAGRARPRGTLLPQELLARGQ